MRISGVLPIHKESRGEGCIWPQDSLIFFQILSAPGWKAPPYDNPLGFRVLNKQHNHPALAYTDVLLTLDLSDFDSLMGIGFMNFRS
jgi:hypothetical protein